MFTLAHLSDLHIPPLPPCTWRDLANKRILGYLSWQRRRRKIHRLEVLEALASDCKAQSPDHIAITGDLTNISLPEEFSRSATWLENLGPKEQISLVPGNHDAYIALPEAQGWRHWRDYMTDKESDGPTPFPFVRQRGPLAIIGLSTALATAPGLASGKVGPSQLRALEEHLSDLKEKGALRIILMHHSPLAGVTSARKGLDDAKPFREVIARQGAELILHGHNHRFEEGNLEGPGGPVPVFSVPSASALTYKDRPAAHYHVYRFEQRGENWMIGIERRGYENGKVAFREKLDLRPLPRQA